MMRALVWLLLLPVLLVAALVLSSPWLIERGLPVLAARAGLLLHIEAASTELLKGQAVLEGVRLGDASRPDMAFESVRLSVDAPALLQGRLSGLRVQMEGGHLAIAGGPGQLMLAGVPMESAQGRRLATAARLISELVLRDVSLVRAVPEGDAPTLQLAELRLRGLGGLADRAVQFELSAREVPGTLVLQGRVLRPDGQEWGMDGQLRAQGLDVDNLAAALGLEVPGAEGARLRADTRVAVAARTDAVVLDSEGRLELEAARMELVSARLTDLAMSWRGEARLALTRDGALSSMVLKGRLGLEQLALEPPPDAPWKARDLALRQGEWEGLLELSGPDQTPRLNADARAERVDLTLEDESRVSLKGIALWGVRSGGDEGLALGSVDVRRLEAFDRGASQPALELTALEVHGARTQEVGAVEVDSIVLTGLRLGPPMLERPAQCDRLEVTDLVVDEGLRAEELVVDGLALKGDPPSTDTYLGAGRMQVREVTLAPASDLSVEMVRLRGASGRLERGPDGVWGRPLETRLATALGAARVGAVEAEGRVELIYSDATVGPPVRLEFGQLEARLLGWNEGLEGEPARLRFEAREESEGRIDGLAELEPGATLPLRWMELDVGRLPIAPISGYLRRYADIASVQGELSGRVSLSRSGDALRVRAGLVAEGLPDRGAAVAWQLDEDARLVVTLALEIPTGPGEERGERLAAGLRDALVEAIRRHFSPLGPTVRRRGKDGLPRSVELRPVAFPPGSAELHREALIYVETLADRLLRRPMLAVRLCGRGPSDAPEIGVRRASKLKERLETRYGVQGRRIRGCGASTPASFTTGDTVLVSVEVL